MKGVGLAVFIIGGLVSLSLTIKYISGSILFYPLFPFYGLYAGFSENDWLPSMWLFGSLAIATILTPLGSDKSENDD